MKNRLYSLNKLKLTWQNRFHSYDFWLQAIALSFALNNIFSSLAGLLISGFFIWKRGWRSLDNQINRGWLAISICLIFTTLTAYDPALAWIGLPNFLPFFWFYAIASHLLSDSFAKKERIAWLITLGSLPVGILGVLQVWLNQPDWTVPRLFNSYVITLGMSADRRITSWFGHFNELGIYLLLVFPLAFYFVKYGGKKERIWAAIALSLDLVNLGFSGSRNAWILAGLALVAIAIFYRYWRILITLVSAALVTIWAIFGEFLGIGGQWLQVLFPASLVERLQSTINPSQTDFASTSDRLHAWQFAWDLIWQRPIFGWGLRSFPLLAAEQGFDLRGLPHEHNFYLMLMVGAGIPVLLGFVALIIWIMFGALKTYATPRELGFFWLTKCAIAMFMLFSLLDIPMFEPRVNLLFWLLLALLCQANLATSASSVSVASESDLPGR